MDINFQDEAIPSMCHESREQQEGSLVTHVKKLERRTLQTRSCTGACLIIILQKGPISKVLIKEPNLNNTKLQSKEARL